MSRHLFFFRLCLALTLFAAALGSAPVLAQGATVVRADVVAASLGGQVTLPIRVENAANLTAFEVHLSFDANIVEVVEISAGGFVAADFVAQSVFDNTAGTIDYAVAQMNRAPAQGSGTLLNVTFRAKSSGVSPLNVRGTQAAPSGFLLSDENGVAISASWASGSVSVGSDAPTATPQTNITTATPMPPTPTASAVATQPTSVPPTTVPPTAVPPTATIPQTPASVRVESLAGTIYANNDFNLFVKIDNAANLSAYEIHLSFNPNLLEVKQLINGGFVFADVVAQNKFDNAAGTIDYAVAQNTRAPAQGSGTLLTIVFRAKQAAGTSNITLRAAQSAPDGLLLADRNGMTLPDTWTNGSVTVVVSSTPAVSQIHTVRWGEWLYCIGRAYGVAPMSIASANGIRWWPYIIYPGQRLTIPNVSWVDMPASGAICQAQFTMPPIVPPVVTPAPVITSVPPTVTPIPPSTTCRFTHYVRSGETLYSIGVMYGIRYEEIARVNRISNPRLIYAGQRLCIP